MLKISHFYSIMTSLIFIIVNTSFSCNWNDYQCINRLFEKNSDQLQSTYSQGYSASRDVDSLYFISKTEKITAVFHTHRLFTIKFENQKNNVDLGHFVNQLELDRLDFDGNEYLYDNTLFIKIDSNQIYQTITYNYVKKPFDNAVSSQSNYAPMGYTTVNTDNNEINKIQSYMALGAGIVFYSDLEIIGPSFGFNFGSLLSSNIGLGGNLSFQMGSFKTNSAAMSIYHFVATVGPVFSTNKEILQTMAIGISPIMADAYLNTPYRITSSKTIIRLAIGYVLTTTTIGLDFHYVIDVGPSIKILYNLN